MTDVFADLGPKLGARVAKSLVDEGEAEVLALACGRHFDQVIRWNRVHNLTRITRPEQATISHYVDGLRAADAIAGAIGVPTETVADVGSGAGFPGVLCALRWPDAQHRWVEPAKKRASFLTEVRRVLSLPHVTVEAIRVQDMEPAALVVSRATIPWREATPIFDKVEPGGWVALLASEEASAEEWKTVAEAWGASSTQRLVYSLPHEGERVVLLAQRPSN